MNATNAKKTRCKLCGCDADEVWQEYGHVVCRDCKSQLERELAMAGRDDGEPMWAIIWGFALWIIIILGGLLLWLVR